MQPEVLSLELVDAIAAIRRRIAPSLSPAVAARFGRIGVLTPGAWVPSDGDPPPDVPAAFSWSRPSRSPWADAGYRFDESSEDDDIVPEPGTVRQRSATDRPGFDVLRGLALVPFPVIERVHGNLEAALTAAPSDAHPDAHSDTHPDAEPADAVDHRPIGVPATPPGIQDRARNQALGPCTEAISWMQAVHPQWCDRLSETVRSAAQDARLGGPTAQDEGVPDDDAGRGGQALLIGIATAAALLRTEPPPTARCSVPEIVGLGVVTAALILYDTAGFSDR